MKIEKLVSILKIKCKSYLHWKSENWKNNDKIRRIRVMGVYSIFIVIILFIFIRSAGNSLEFKGFYLGMPIMEAQKNINNQFGLEHVTSEYIKSEPDEGYLDKPKTPPSNPRDNPLFKSLIDAFNGNSPIEGSFMIFEKGDDLHLTRQGQKFPFAIANKDQEVVKYILTRDIINKLFDASKMSISEFLQAFIENYNIPVLEPDVIPIYASILGFKQESGKQEILYHESPEGFTVIYYGKIYFTGESQMLVATYIPEETLVIYKSDSQLEKQKHINKNFN